MGIYTHMEDMEDTILMEDMEVMEHMGVMEDVDMDTAIINR